MTSARPRRAAKHEISTHENRRSPPHRARRRHRRRRLVGGAEAGGQPPHHRRGHHRRGPDRRRQCDDEQGAWSPQRLSCCGRCCSANVPTNPRGSARSCGSTRSGKDAAGRSSMPSAASTSRCGTSWARSATSRWRGCSAACIGSASNRMVRCSSTSRTCCAISSKKRSPAASRRSSSVGVRSAGAMRKQTNCWCEQRATRWVLMSN